MKTKLTLPGLKELFLPQRLATDAANGSAILARALFGPPDTASAERRRSLVDFLKQVTLFQDLGHSDLQRLARIVHEREYRDGEYICEQGKPAAALFVLRRGLVEIVRRGTNAQEVPLATLEPPASFDESAAIGMDALRWFSARASGPVSLLALGKSDVDALMVNFPLLANKVLMRLAAIMATRLHMLLDAQYLRESEEHQEADRDHRRL